MLFILWMLNAAIHFVELLRVLISCRELSGCRSAKAWGYMLRSGLITILTMVKRMWQEMWSQITRGQPMTGIQRRVCEPSYIYITVHMQQVEEEECPLGLPHRGRGTTGGDIRCRGEPAAAQIDFYHDTYYCQLTAGDRGAVSGCGVRRGWAAYRLLPQIDPSVKLYNHGEGPY